MSFPIYQPYNCSQNPIYPKSNITSANSSLAITSATQQINRPFTINQQVDMLKSLPKLPYYQQLKKAENEGKNSEVTNRKVYNCMKCHQPMRSSNHSQYRGKRYCPNETVNLPFNEWLDKVKKYEL